ncbi:triose-phosphate isomerase [Patescibacteria group bacterium]|nr:triose-phosphate isomerase [Patescibacteria group bacterium]MBU0964021.1 triose-phosphate isomerase [Patescibacteria group bacterium]
MKQKPYIIANWKMNLDRLGIERFFSNFSPDEEVFTKLKVVICPSFPLLEFARSQAKEKIAIGAQNFFWEAQGAFTGEVSARQLASMGIKYAILGHSDRRRIFNEDDELINKKIQLALQFKINPIICLGETFEEKEAGLTKKVIKEKVATCLRDVQPFDVKYIIISYEPIWAISTNPRNIDDVADTPEEAQVMHKFIRKIIAELYNDSVAASLPIIYGGSVNPDNAGGFAKMDDIDGVLVGGASKEGPSFGKIIISFLANK